jgi:hypothetical protein
MSSALHDPAMKAHKATPFASAAIARANGGFCFLISESQIVSAFLLSLMRAVDTKTGVADDLGFAFSVSDCRSD